MVGNEATRRVFELPNMNLGVKRGKDDPSVIASNSIRGTTDLNFCKRLMRDDIFTKAGWPAYQKKEFPFLIDTNILVQHIDNAGRMYPLGGVPLKNKPVKGQKPKEIK